MKTTKRPSALNIGLNEVVPVRAVQRDKNSHSRRGAVRRNTGARIAHEDIQRYVGVFGHQVGGPDAKAMYRPSALIERSSANDPSPATETDVVAGVHSEGAPAHGDDNVKENWVGYGSTIVAPGTGTVISADNEQPDEMDFDETKLSDAKVMVGNYLIIDHGNGEFSAMAHFKKGSITVKPGETRDAWSDDRTDGEIRNGLGTDPCSLPIARWPRSFQFGGTAVSVRGGPSGWRVGVSN